MSQDVKKISQEENEPSVRQGAVFLPMWIIGLLALLIYWGFNFVGENGGDYEPLVYQPYSSTNELASMMPVDETVAQMKLGAQVYGNVCAACHQPNGGGNPAQAPPLAGSEWVLAPGPNRIIRIPLVCLQGPIKAAGKEFNGAMLAVAANGALSDEQVAAVLTYIRNSFGNKASRVTVEQVKKVHDELKSRAESYTPDELMKLPDTL